MIYRKLKGSKIFTGFDFAAADDVLILNENGIIEAIINDNEAGENIEFFEGIISPGFVNAHCHIELSHLKNKIPQHTGLVTFVQQVMTSRTADLQEKESAMLAAEKELYESGTVAVGDICNTTDSINLKSNSKMYWHNFIEVSGFVDIAAQKRYEGAELVKAAFKRVLEERNRMGKLFHGGVIVPHAPYSVSKTLFEIINQNSKNEIISIHNQEAAAEDELYYSKNGDFLNLYENFGIDISSFKATEKSSFQTWVEYFTQNQKIISVHNTFTTEEDLSYAQNYLNHLHFCICINANLYIENKLPPIELLMNMDCNIVLGTDSYASNWSLNIFDEIKSIQKNFPTIPLQKILQWATINGAKALGIDTVYGSFEKGKAPGVVLLKGDEATRIL